MAKGVITYEGTLRCIDMKYRLPPNDVQIKISILDGAGLKIITLSKIREDLTTRALDKQFTSCRV